MLKCYTQRFDFAGLAFVEAVRAYLSPFRLPGEAQKIDRIMCTFSAHYCTNNPGVFADDDAAYVLAFAIIMLNTDAHSSQIKKRMTLPEFISNNRGINAGDDLPEQLLSSVYHDITHREIKTGTEFDDLAEAELVEWLQRGTIFEKYAHGKISAARSHSCRLWVRNDVGQLCYANLANKGKKEKTVPLDEISDVLMGPSSETFKRHGITAQSTEGDACFSLVFGGRTLDLRAPSADEVSVWAAYFKQVVKRSRLEAHARHVAMRAQPRETFVEMASAVWRDEVLPNWPAERAAKRTLMLWWEGIPSALRGQVARLGH